MTAIQNPVNLDREVAELARNMIEAIAAHNDLGEDHIVIPMQVEIVYRCVGPDSTEIRRSAWRVSDSDSPAA